jgi:anti-sigma factor RsiW
MDKRQIKLDMMAYLYGELSPDEKRRFEDALDADPELRQEWNALREVRNRLSDLADKEVLEPMLLLDRKPSGAFTGFLAPRAYTCSGPCWPSRHRSSCSWWRATSPGSACSAMPPDFP